MQKSLLDFVICFTILLGFHLARHLGLPIYFSLIPVALISLYMVFVPSSRAVTIACSLSAFNSIHYLFYSNMSVFNEPVIYKSIKDILLFGLVVNLLFKVKRNDIRFSNLIQSMWPFILFIVMMLVHGVLFSIKGNYISIMLTLRYLLVYPLTGLLCVGAFDSLEKKEIFFNMLVLVGSVAVCLEFWELSAGINTGFVGYVNIGPIHQRAVSSLQNPNNCALFLSIPFMYVLSKIYTKGLRLLSAAILFLLFVGIILTFSRSVLISLMFSIIIMALIHRSLPSFLLLPPFLLTIILLYVYTTSIRMRDAGEGVFSSALPALSNILGRLLFGIGRSSPAWAGKTGMEWLTGIGYGSEQYVTTDSMYAALFLGGGIFTVLSFLAMITGIGHILYKLLNKSGNEDRHIAILIFCVFIIIIFHMFSAITLKLYPVSLIFWILVSMALGMYFKKAENADLA